MLRKRNTAEKYDSISLNARLNEEANTLGFKNAYFKDTYLGLENIPKSIRIDNVEPIKYSLLSTFAVFGVLLFNSIRRQADLRP